MFSIVTDDAADYAKPLPVRKLKFPVFLEEKQVELSREEIVKLLEEGKIFKTSQVPPQEFLKAFKEEEEPILAITIASKLSGTYNSALLAARMSGKKVLVLDSGNISVAEGMVVAKAVELREKGLSIEEAFKELEEFKKRVRLYFTVENFTYLARSGRINNVIAAIGNFMKLNPVMMCHLGEVKLVKLVRSYEKAVDELAKLAEGKEAMVGEIASRELAEKLANKLNAEIASLTPALAAHAGKAVVVGVIE